MTWTVLTRPYQKTNKLFYTYRYSWCWWWAVATETRSQQPQGNFGHAVSLCSDNATSGYISWSTGQYRNGNSVLPCKFANRLHGKQKTAYPDKTGGNLHEMSKSIFWKKKYCKNLSWVWGVDRKIRPKGYCLASRGLPSDVRLWSWGMDFSVCPTHLW